MVISRKHLPKPEASICQEYRNLVADLDTRMAELIENHFPSALQCRPGCESCCIEFSVSALEAAMIAHAVQGEGERTPQDQGKCRLLVNGRCTIYASRPIICRTQGLPLGYVDEAAGTIEVSACHLNFPDEYPLVYEDLLLMDSFNRRLAELNAKYCKKNGLVLEERFLLDM